MMPCHENFQESSWQIQENGEIYSSLGYVRLNPGSLNDFYPVWEMAGNHSSPKKS